MSTYRPLYSFRIEHDYFVGGICRALQCAVLPSGQELMTQRGLQLRQTAQNEWTVLYDADGAGVDTASDAIALGLSISDLAFVYIQSGKDSTQRQLTVWICRWLIGTPLPRKL